MKIRGTWRLTSCVIAHALRVGRDWPGRDGTVGRKWSSKVQGKEAWSQDETSGPQVQSEPKETATYGIHPVYAGTLSCH